MTDSVCESAKSTSPEIELLADAIIRLQSWRKWRTESKEAAKVQAITAETYKARFLNLTKEKDDDDQTTAGEIG